MKQKYNLCLKPQNCIYSILPSWTKFDSKSDFEWSSADLNSNFPSSRLIAKIKLSELDCFMIYSELKRRSRGFMPFPKFLSCIAPV